MGIWDKVKQSLGSGVPEPLVLPDALVFNAIDTTAVAQKVNLEANAVNDGTKNHPSVTSGIMSQTEIELISVVISTARPYLQNYDSQQLAYKNRLASLDPLGLASKFRGQASLQINQIKTRIDQESGSFYLLRDSLQEIESDWQAFKQRWGIKVDPVLSTKRNTGATQIAAQQFLEITYPTHGSEILMNCASTLWITIWCCTRRLANTFICCRSSIIGSFRLTLRRIGALIR